MKALFASEYFGTLGLIIFFTIFMIVLFLVLKPGAKEKAQNNAQIPLREDD